MGEVELLARTLALAAVVLPVAGVVVRLTAFLFSDIYIPPRVAWSAPVSELVVAGLFSQTVVMALLWLYVELGKLLPVVQRAEAHLARSQRVEKELSDIKKALGDAMKGGHGDDEADHDLIRRLEVLEGDVEQMTADMRETDALIAGLGVKNRTGALGWIERHLKWLVLMLFLPVLLFIPGVIWAELSSMLAAFVGMRILSSVGKRRGRLTFGTTWYAFVLAMLLGAIGFGLSDLGVAAPVAHYSFGTDTGLQSGDYALLADTGGTYQLVNCVGTKRVSEVTKSQVNLVQYPPRRPPVDLGPALWQVLLGQASMEVGFTLTC